jgi:methylenetetrahydrofolate reductase (NADPH)
MSQSLSPSEMSPSPTSTLQKALDAGQFAVTAELMPPKGPDVEDFLAHAAALRGRVCAVNVTDCSRAILRMSSLAASALLIRHGVDAVFQLTCRDRNVLALQSDLLGAAALGVRNVLALTGDGIRHGDHPEAKAVFEVESLGLLRLIHDLNRSLSATGQALNAPAGLLPGAVVNPNYMPGTSHRKRYRKKVEGGAKFFQTQMLTSFDAFADFMEFARPLGAKVIGGVLLIKSLKNALFLNNKVPGIHIGEDILRRFEARDGLDTGLDIAAEQVRRCADLCDGVHLMVLGREDLIPEILDRAGF